MEVLFLVVRVDVLYSVLEWQDWIKNLCESDKVPMANVRLEFISIPPFVVRMIANKLWIEVFHESIRTIVNSQTEDAHVVSIQHTMAESITLP